MFDCCEAFFYDDVLNAYLSYLPRPGSPLGCCARITTPARPETMSKHGPGALHTFRWLANGPTVAALKTKAEIAEASLPFPVLQRSHAVVRPSGPFVQEALQHYHFYRLPHQNRRGSIS